MRPPSDSADNNAGWHAYADDIRRTVEWASREDTEYAARLYYRVGRGLMRSAGIRSPAELYDVLRQLYRLDERVVFGDHQSMGFGRVNRARQVRNFVAEHAGEPRDILAMGYERTYGFSAGVCAMWIDQYTQPGGISFASWLGRPGAGDGGKPASGSKAAVEPSGGARLPVHNSASLPGKPWEVPTEVGEFLARELSGDIRDTALVRRRFAYEFPDRFKAEEFGRSLADAGYYENHGLLFRSGATPKERLSRLISSRPSFARGDPGFENAVWKHPVFRVALRKALENHQVLAYEPDSYVSFARLHDVLGLHMADITSYASAVSVAVPERVPFTVYSLHVSGIVSHTLDALEMPDTFYEGLLDASGLLRSCTIAGTKVFCVGGEDRMSAASLVEWLVARHEGIARDDLSRLLQEELGIACPAAQLAVIVWNSGVYHDDVGDALYSSMEAWKQEVRNELA